VRYGKPNKLAGNDLKADFAAEKLLASLEGRKFDAPEFWSKYAPSKERLWADVEEASSKDRSRHQPRLWKPSVPGPPELYALRRNDQFDLKKLLARLVAAGCSMQRIAKELTQRSVPKAGRGKEAPWTVPGVQHLLAQASLRVERDRTAAAHRAWVRKDPKRRLCAGCERRSFLLHRGQPDKKYCSRACAARANAKMRAELAKPALAAESRCHVCPQCGRRTELAKPALAARRRYCSRGCSNRARAWQPSSHAAHPIARSSTTRTASPTEPLVISTSRTATI
jgi:hypothetical protein